MSPLIVHLLFQGAVFSSSRIHISQWPHNCKLLQEIFGYGDSFPFWWEGGTQEQTCWQEHKMAICLTPTRSHKAVLPKASSIPSDSQYCIASWAGATCLLLQVRDLCMWEMFCHFFHAFIKNWANMVLICYTCSLFPVDLSDLPDGTL